MAIEHPAWRKRVRRSTTWLINEAAAALCRKQMLVDFVYQVNTINGEGYDSIPQTRAVIDAVTRGDAQQQHEEDFVVTVNLHDAYRLVEQAAGESRQPVLTISAIQRLHKVLFQNRDGWEAEAGRFRDRDVWVRLKDGSFHQFVEHSQVPHRLQQLLGDTNTKLDDVFCTEQEDLATFTAKLLHLAVDFFLNFELIHPFRDGNGRVGRLLLAYLLSSITPQLAPNNAYLVDSEDIVDYGLYRSCFQEEKQEGQHASSSETRDPGRLIAIYTEGLYVGWKKFFVAAGMEAPQTCRTDDDPGRQHSQ
ncbi:adenosine monophosphate-protein transferase fic-1 [Selaginella moellendorffii]|uniref:adenosine monophosphate-protein transferase fic-1 n=1 Tax=Selaginella moellendorffii TaxID=88036 RepID=UPI000D1C2BCD|nr:adenosine monophosphate-protein transferase fic-1 [Selaginella moellendorffii]|eukprot:XP_024542721.1 adenosine monophosphate-protein transferase fic-1 [Selaginella moellendorffii]